MQFRKAKRTVTTFAVAALALFVSATYLQAAQWADQDILIDAQTLEKQIDNPDWVVIDCRDLKDYIKGHIPGAISLGKKCKQAFRDPTVKVWQDPQWYENFLGKVGIGNDTTVVLYHEGIKTVHHSGVGFWVMEWLGHDNGKTKVLNGGIDAWRKDGNRLSQRPTKKPEKTFKVNIVPSRLATTDEILRIATGAQQGVQLIDSRTKKEHTGAVQYGLRGGHVPNTILHVDHKETVQRVKDPKTGKMKPTGYLVPEVLEEKFGHLDRNTRTIGYCQTGTRSSLTYLELRLLGFKDPANWDDSWRVWSSNYQDYPVEAPNGEQWVNFKSIFGDLKKLKKKVAKLEDQLSAKK